jgi:aspartate/methionine/tyrosine aminotransferase
MAFAVPIAERAQQLLNLSEPTEVQRTLVPASIREAAIVALNRGETHYTDRPGILPLRQKVAEFLRARFDVTVNPKSSVVITCGATEARFVAVQQLLQPGQTLRALSHSERVQGAAIVRGLSLLTASDADADTGAIYLNSLTPEDIRSRWLARAKDSGGWVIFEVMGDAAFHPAAAGLLEQTVTIGAIGDEAGLAAWRVGFLAAPEKNATPLRDFKQALTICTTNLSQWAALAHLEQV